MIASLVDVAEEEGCYKVILDCSEANAAFYEKCGMTRKEVQMVSSFSVAAADRILMYNLQQISAQIFSLHMKKAW